MSTLPSNCFFLLSSYCRFVAIFGRSSNEGPTEDFPEEFLEDWYEYKPPCPTVKGKMQKKGQFVKGKGRFLRYVGGQITRECSLFRSKLMFNADGTRKNQSNTPSPDLDLSMATMMNAINLGPLRKADKVLWNSDIVGGSHNISQLCVLDIVKVRVLSANSTPFHLFHHLFLSLCPFAML